MEIESCLEQEPIKIRTIQLLKTVFASIFAR